MKWNENLHVDGHGITSELSGFDIGKELDHLNQSMVIVGWIPLNIQKQDLQESFNLNEIFRVIS